jgi:hypothetical protein
MLNRSDTDIKAVVTYLAKFSVEGGYLVPTQTGLEKSILDAHESLRKSRILGTLVFTNTQADLSGFGAGLQLARFVQSFLGMNIKRNTSLEIGYRYLYFI